MATKKRRKTDFWCCRCKRPLSHFGPSKKDTITFKLHPEGVSYTHDDCGGSVVAGG